MSSECHMVQQMVEWKSKFDASFESLLNELNSLTCDVLVSALGNNSLKEDQVRLKEDWTVLQLDVTDKIKGLVVFQDSLNKRYSEILRKTEYSIFSRQDYSDGSQISTFKSRNPKYVPDSRFLSQ